ncbi:maleylpyruvate isomerase N-terminal domain-containing protein [Mucilaginibacter sp.]|uniref:maleylpyruvate isomerase N-terminal domain-containing protein n=1 Tax=Mucilaginibacter sp. TaxID=1882438 RepID=UPI0026144ACB|nr:maleylpyruvate isomerase N-terminal domain-containing protein [Mucilaginibacter sp.]MDB5127013.1 hypothetical protein [Mucilaginibacter sp.]
MQQIIPIPTLHLFPVLDELLIELLTSLSADDWNKPTVARLWTVKDIAAHLLDTNVRTISYAQGYEVAIAKQINSYQELVAYLNELNATWVNAMKRVSPQLLIHQLESTGKQYIQYLNTLKPFEQAKYSVAWAGEETSLNWFDIAREYTEKWHHQQQIRDAVGIPGLITKELFYPCIDTFMYALPHSYRNIDATEDTVIKITVSSNIGGDWYLQKAADNWQLLKQQPSNTIHSEVIIDPDTTWKFLTKAITPQAAMAKSTVMGNTQLGNTVFSTIAVMA